MIPGFVNLLLALGTTASASVETANYTPRDAAVTSAKTYNSNPVKPSHDSAEENANRVFNAIQSVGRQWGSAIYHNGFSFMPTVMPKGTLIYHGSHSNHTPPGPEWLAFEIEHAENFAVSFKRRHGEPYGPHVPGQKPPSEPAFREDLRRRDGDGSMENTRGYLHTYRANRDLNLLLIDGMSAAKTSMGTLDSQDLLLRENTTKHEGQGGMGEWPRALDICDLVVEWGYDGVVRNEIGFEVIYCDFSTGVDRVSMTRTFVMGEQLGHHMMQDFDWTRAVAERYDGIGGDRLHVDYSSMVSGLFFPINISSLDSDRPDLLRLGSATLGELKDIKQYLKNVATQPRRFTVNWQAVVDMIVSRFAKRLAVMASITVSWRVFIAEIETSTLCWFDAPALPHDASVAGEDALNRTAEAVDRCRKHFLLPATLSQEEWSAEDELIFTSIDVVMRSICQNLFRVRAALLDAAPGSSINDYRIAANGDDNEDLERAVDTGRIVIQELMDSLAWSTWKQAQPCKVDEVLFIAMWPIGDKEDHWNPGCRSIDQIAQTSRTYWEMKRPF
ncbi:hypothetical protein G7046_g8312 [Stylonectria norvegica]|nr:hypothetical protein G7046_g8312 [Stylonectria norvegica]